MKIIIDDAPKLKDAVDTIVNLVEEGLFEVGKDGRLRDGNRIRRPQGSQQVDMNKKKLSGHVFPSSSQK